MHKQKLIRIVAFAVIAIAAAASFFQSSGAAQDHEVGASSQDQTGAGQDAQNAEDRADPETALRERVLKAAREYKDFGRVDDEARWAPFLCRMPNPSTARVSASEDDGTHGGQKLYFMFAKNRRAYTYVGHEKMIDSWQDEMQQKLRDEVQSQAGQVIVKESWLPKETDGAINIQQRSLLTDEERQAMEKYMTDETQRTLPFATHDGKTFYAAEKAGLFLMLRADEDNEYEAANSVNGWVFATTTPDGKEITAVGKVQNCAACHKDAPHNGLFGIPGDFSRW